MNISSLGEYVAGRIRSGASKIDVKEELLSVGWAEEEADAAYRDGVVMLGIPVPNEGSRPTLMKKSSTVDIVINFFSFILLGIVATALGILFFCIIEQVFPDSLSVDPYATLSVASSIHYAVAALLIGFPLYAGALFLWFRIFREDEARAESRLSQWLTYIVLLAASVTLVGDLIMVVYTFLQGEITWRFFLKACTVFGIAGVIFGFYFLERKKIQYHRDISRKTFQIFGWSVAGLVCLGIFLGFFVGGSPDTARKQGFDVKRANDLSSLSECIRGYASSFGSLPDSTDVLKRSSTYAYCASSMKDPETGMAYAYRVVVASRTEGESRVGEFELCADFSLASDGSRETAYSELSLWNTHGIGRACDTVTAQLGTLAPVVPMKK